MINLDCPGPHAQFEERLRFERLIADLSSKFVDLPADEVDPEIVDAQRRICEALGLDLSGLWQWSDEDGGSLWLSHLFHVDKGLLPAERLNAGVHYPWCQRQMLAGRTVVVTSLETLPAEAAVDRENSRQSGIMAADWREVP